MSATCVLRRRRRKAKRRRDAAGLRIASDGLTVDTCLGSVDTVAIDRVLAGRSVDLTAAEVVYLFTVLPATMPAVRPVAAALDLSPYTVRDRARRGALTATKVA
jgi:hypothetical protein